VAEALRVGGVVIVLLCICAGAVLVATQHTAGPLRATRLMALAAGNRQQVYGANSAVLAPVLASESKALRALGRTAEAEEIDRRMSGLQQNTPGPNSSMATPH
jgi:hypothetical protein